MLETNEEYRRLYIGYKVMVEHKPIPKRLLNDLTLNAARELVKEYEKQEKAYSIKLKKVFQKR